jgi:hypothetical protein
MPAPHVISFVGRSNPIILGVSAILNADLGDLADLAADRPGDLKALAAAEASHYRRWAPAAEDPSVASAYQAAAVAHEAAGAALDGVLRCWEEHHSAHDRIMRALRTLDVLDVADPARPAIAAAHSAACKDRLAVECRLKDAACSAARAIKAAATAQCAAGEAWLTARCAA